MQRNNDTKRGTKKEMKLCPYFLLRASEHAEKPEAHKQKRGGFGRGDDWRRYENIDHARCLHSVRGFGG
jgi:hypothetical protein